jgi:hypothetical protein
MGYERDLDEQVEQAWTAFRGRLADHVAGMGEHEVLVVEYADALTAAYGDDAAEHPEGLGAAPYVQVLALSDDWLALESVGDAFLDTALLLTSEQESRLTELGWTAPVEDEDGEPENYWTEARSRDADRVAVLLVDTLREVFAVPHPVFLQADGLEVDPDIGVEPAAAQPGRAADEPDLTVALPRSSDHLRELVDEAMGQVFLDLQHDGDGDIPIRAGSSVVYVRVLADRPAVEVYAEVVVDPVDRARLPLEVGLLNRAHPGWQFVALDHAVVMRQELLAVPFSGMQLRIAVDRFVAAVDGIAQDLAARVGGRLFHEPEPADVAPEPVPDDDLAMVGLLELCELGRPRAATVAGLFGHDRIAIIRQIVRLRTGRQPCGVHDLDDVLDALRRALRLVADGGPPGPTELRRPA